MKQIAVKKFTTDLVLEYSSTPIPVELGTFENEMTLYLSESGEKGFIEWYYFNENEDGCEEIGLWFDNGYVVDYDGVFSLPEQAVELLKERGYDCSEVVVEEE